jgi:hypothetical protein
MVAAVDNEACSALEREVVAGWQAFANGGGMHYGSEWWLPPRR